MIARLWHGAVPVSKSDEHLKFMRTIAIPDYGGTPGNHGAYALCRTEGDIAHFVMLTFWESRAAIQNFAGEDINVAKYYDFDHDFLLELEPRVKHFEVYPPGCLKEKLNANSIRAYLAVTSHRDRSCVLYDPPSFLPGSGLYMGKTPSNARTFGP